MNGFVKIALLLALALSPCGCTPSRVPGEAVRSAPAESYPRIVLYSLAGCPHCKEAKQYLAERNIPYVNRDVGEDPEALDALVNRYGERQVPLIVIGDDAAILHGFDPAKFEKTLQEFMNR